MPLKVFISHCWRDKKRAAYKEIEMSLRDAGHDVWLDSHEIEFGDDVRKTFLAALPQADVVLVLWSEHSLGSDAQRLEVETAAELRKEILPCKIGKADPSKYPDMEGRKYASFDQNVELGLRFMNQYLIRLAARKNAAVSADPGLRRQIEALDGGMAELGDVAHRRGLRADPGEAEEVARSSSTYVRGMARAMRQMAEASDGSPENRVLHRLADRVEAIARAHPDPKDDELCKSLFVEALEECDPDGESPRVQMFRQTLAASGITAPARESEDSDDESDVPHSDAPTPLHAHVAAVLRRPGADRHLEGRLRELGVGASQLAGYVASLRRSAQEIPDLLFALAQSAQQAQVGHLVGPILQKAQNYFLEFNDAIPEQRGTLGLMDDTYLVHAFLVQLNAAYAQSAGVPLVNFDPSPTMNVVRPIIGPQIAAEIEQFVVGEVNQAVQQSYYEQLHRQRASIDVSRSPTGGPGAWGPCVEDEISRLGAELGISMP